MCFERAYIFKCLQQLKNNGIDKVTDTGAYMIKSRRYVNSINRSLCDICLYQGQRVDGMANEEELAMTIRPRCKHIVHLIHARASHRGRLGVIPLKRAFSGRIEFGAV